ncbi:MAG: hotdog domain-containing protein [Enterobacterales bacterium]|nr:hotdog domain-containing protein [Enterobacterales bacterium]
MSIQSESKIAEEIQNWTLVFPNQANPNGVMFGGDLLAIMDTTAAMAAKRFCQMQVSTVSVEAVHFAKPIRVGDTIKTTAKVVAVGQTSMMIKTEAFRDIGDSQLEPCVSAYYNLVAFDNQYKKAQVPRLQVKENTQIDHQIAQVVKNAAQQRQALLTKIKEL